MRPSRHHARPILFAIAASLTLVGCETLSSIDWQDKGSVGPAAVDSSRLSEQVADRLAATPMTMNEQIKVVLLQDNRIRLSGYVGSTSAQSEAVRIARQVEGVSDVLDTMAVR